MAGFKRDKAMRRGNDDDDAGFSDLKLAKAMNHADVKDVWPAGANFFANFANI